MREAQTGLAMLGPVAPIGPRDAQAFQDAHGAGLGITEYEPDGKGAEEIHELWRWIERKLEKLSHEPQADYA